METAAKQYAVTFGLACALALMAMPSPLVQTRAGVQGAGTLAQYCARNTTLRTCSASIAAIAAERQRLRPRSCARSEIASSRIAISLRGSVWPHD